MVKASNNPPALHPEDAKRALPMPPFTIKQLRDAIPSHCFKRSVLKSFLWVLHDLIICGSIVYAATFIQYAPFWARCLLWPLYWVVEGTCATGLWVIAHECGHQAFSDFKWLNDAVGLVLHSALLVPYHSWRITHGNHHKNTNHMDRDQVFVPSTRSDLAEAFDDAPIKTLFDIFVTVTFGWPAYLVANVSGQSYDRRANHFEPSSPIFKPHHRTDVVISDIGLLVVGSILATWVYFTSFATMLCWYFMPYLVVNFFLVTITLLQHTHRDVPH